MAEQKSEENIIFLPWTVESQPQTQAVILQQPSETHLRLDATTDKTAIASFIIATIIALALGGLATWLAYWYGRKSFDLTKQSFDALIKQIESSEQITMASNIGFAQSQADNKLMELRFLYKSSEIENMRKMISDYFTTVISLNNYMVFKVGRLTDHNFIDNDAKEKYINELFDEVKQKLTRYFLNEVKLHKGE